MKIVRDLDRAGTQVRGGILTIGNFDGVHRGHARIVGRAVQWARDQHLPAVVFTFDPHPASLLRPEHALAPLTWIEWRAELLGRLGVDAVIAYPTDWALLRLTCREFFQSIVRERLDARGLVEGPDFRFGRGREGTVESLGQLCRDAGLKLAVEPPCIYRAEPISSSRIRRALADGRVKSAAEMLGRPHRTRGVVAPGVGRGRQIGFPSANLERIDVALPANGVYAGRAFHAGRRWAAAINVGPNPTFGEQGQKVEAALLDFDGDLYGETLQIEFLRRLRDVVKFGSVDELTVQLRRDVEQTRAIVAEADAGAESS